MAKSGDKRRLPTYTFRVAATPAGHRRLAEVYELMRALYNGARDERIMVYRASRQWSGKGRSVSYEDQCGSLVALRASDSAYEAVASALERGVLRRIDRAFGGFCRRAMAGGKAGFPRHKSVARWRTLEIDDVYQGWLKRSGDHLVFNAKGMPPLCLYGHREIPDAPVKSIRIMRRGRTLEAALVFDLGELPERCEPRTAIGVDMGVTDVVALSDGTRYEGAPSRSAEIERKQRRLARVKKGSRERRKRRRVLANAWRRKRVRDRNWRHRISTDIVRKADWIAIEDLSLANMVRSAKGTVDSPGKNVAAKAGLNRALREQGLGMMRSQFTYKAEWAGKWLSIVRPEFTSQACHVCGVIEKESRNGKVYECRSCGITDDADVNGACNVLARSLAGVELGVRPLPRRSLKAA